MNPMYANQDLEEVQHDLDKPRIAVYAQRKGLQFYQTRSHAVAPFNTLLAICIEKVVYIKTGEDVYCKVYQSPRLPRVVLTLNLQPGCQDPFNRTEKIRRPPKRTKREVQGNLSIASQGHSSQASRGKSQSEVQGNLSR